MNQAKQEFRMQELHTPSAFEGALWATCGIRDAVTIVHAPPGCYINQHVNMLVNDWSVELYSTNLSYADVMQGAENRLEEVLRSVIARTPQAVFIVTAPSVEVTQDDVEGVAARVGFKNTVIVRPPIGGGLRDGKEAAFLKMLELVEPAPKKNPKSVNIIGPTLSTFNWMADVCELTRMLEGIGVTVNTVISAGATVAQIRNASRAGLNLCVYPYDVGLALAGEMQQRFGIPFLADPVPIGFGNCAAWLETIAGLCGAVDTGFVRREMQSAIAFARANMFFTVSFELTAAVSCDNNNTYAVGISEFLAREAGTTVVMGSVSTAEAAARLQEVCGSVLVSPTIEQKREAFVASAPMAIFGNFYDKKISLDEGFQNFIFADIPTIGYLCTENCPFMGFRGAKFLIQAMVNEVYMKIFLETKGAMEGPISGGEVPWDLEAQQVLMKVSEMIPHFVRATAVKKLHQEAEQRAHQRASSVTVAIVRDVADAFTPTKFKAKFSSVFDDDGAAPESAGDDEDVPVDSLTFSMPWEDAAKEMLELVPSPFRQAAVSGTEEYARGKGRAGVTGATVEEYRRELGM